MLMSQSYTKKFRSSQQRVANWLLVFQPYARLLYAAQLTVVSTLYSNFIAAEYLKNHPDLSPHKLVCWLSSRWIFEDGV